MNVYQPTIYLKIVHCFISQDKLGYFAQANNHTNLSGLFLVYKMSVHILGNYPRQMPLHVAPQQLFVTSSIIL
jgi:hypothetical protein